MNTVTYKDFDKVNTAMPAADIPLRTFFLANTSLGRSLFFKDQTARIYWVVPGDRKEVELDLCEYYKLFDKYEVVDVEIVVTRRPR